MVEHTVVIKDGVIEFIYADDLLALSELGPTTTKRASHVEPHPTKPGWLADMRPSLGRIVDAGGNESFSELPLKIPGWRDMPLDELVARIEEFVALTPFATREEALAAERAWLAKERGL